LAIAAFDVWAFDVGKGDGSQYGSDVPTLQYPGTQLLAFWLPGRSTMGDNPTTHTPKWSTTSENYRYMLGDSFNWEQKLAFGMPGIAIISSVGQHRTFSAGFLDGGSWIHNPNSW
jgi:hypothetical protein